jgi:hypothetical protein
MGGAKFGGLTPVSNFRAYSSESGVQLTITFIHNWEAIATDCH